jgi:NitT/TauT family transport system substrate-binding protein
MRMQIMASRHSAFYSPLLCAVKFLRDEEYDVPYSVLAPGQRSHVLIRDHTIDIMQSAVSSNWKSMERGVEPLPVHFAQINQRDGFFIVGREPDPAFEWKKLEGRTLLADHGLQPLVMLKYAVRHNGVDWNKIKVIDAGTPEQMESAFRSKTADYVHLQGPIVAGEIVASVGASMPPVAFSSLCCARDYQKTEGYRTFLRVYEHAKSGSKPLPPRKLQLQRILFSRLSAPNWWSRPLRATRPWVAGKETSKSSGSCTNRL